MEESKKEVREVVDISDTIICPTCKTASKDLSVINAHLYDTNRIWARMKCMKCHVLLELNI